MEGERGRVSPPPATAAVLGVARNRAAGAWEQTRPNTTCRGRCFPPCRAGFLAAGEQQLWVVFCPVTRRTGLEGKGSLACMEGGRQGWGNESRWVISAVRIRSPETRVRPLPKPRPPPYDQSTRQLCPQSLAGRSMAVLHGSSQPSPVTGGDGQDFCGTEQSPRPVPPPPQPCPWHKAQPCPHFPVTVWVNSTGSQVHAGVTE